MKYDKKGFTLVELIVVIAIMAVLAGVVSGATVGILNKKTDEVNYIYTYTTENKFLHKSFRGRRKSLNALRSSPNLRGSKSTCMAVSTKYGRMRTRKPLTIP